MNKLSIVAILASALLFSCGGEETKSKPIQESTKKEAAAPDVNTKPEKFDPVKSQTQEPAGPLTSISFDSYIHDFGVMDEGAEVVHTFEFTNTGAEPLILDKCKGSCGCTVPVCPKDPIPPGGTGSIEVKFNSKGKKNSQTKKVYVNANTDPVQTLLTIKAQVTPAPVE